MEAQPTEEATAKQVQAAVNVLRKAETRVAKIAGDQKTKAARFEEYERQIMTAFLSEKKKHADHQERMANELIDAQQHLAEARAALARTIEGATQPRAMEQDSDLDEWTAMVRRHAAQSLPPAVDPGLLELLRAYKNGALPVFPGVAAAGERPSPVSNLQSKAAPSDAMAPIPPGQATQPPETAPASRAGATTEVPLKAYGAVSPGATARSAPYPNTSPAARRPPVTGVDHEELLVPGHTKGAEGIPEARTPVRVSVKDASKQPPSKPTVPEMSLQQKLEEKRAAEMGEALRPFRLSTTSEEKQGCAGLHPVAGVGDAGGQPPPPTARLLDDDPDGPGGPRSPGFAGME